VTALKSDRRTEDDIILVVEIADDGTGKVLLQKIQARVPG